MRPSFQTLQMRECFRPDGKTWIDHRIQRRWQETLPPLVQPCRHLNSCSLVWLRAGSQFAALPFIEEDELRASGMMVPAD